MFKGTIEDIRIHGNYISAKLQRVSGGMPMSRSNTIFYCEYYTYCHEEIIFILKVRFYFWCIILGIVSGRVFLGVKSVKNPAFFAREKTQNKPCKSSRENHFFPVQI